MSVERAISEHSCKVYSVLSRTGLTRADVEDAMQDVFAVFFHRYAEIAPAAELSFLVSTAVRVAADRRRLKWNRSSVELVDEHLSPEGFEPAEDRLDAKRQQATAAEVLGMMPAEDRTLLRLAYVLGQSRSQIAHVVGIPNGTVATRLAKARVNFERYMRRIQRHSDIERQVDVNSLPWAAPGRFTQGTAVMTDSFARMKLGTVHCINNQWGRARTRGHFEQCLVTREHEGRGQVGWTWNWPDHHPLGLGYPQVFVGYGPWVGGDSTDDRLPAQLDQLDRLGLDFAIPTECDGHYQLLADLWLLHDRPSNTDRNPGLISEEVMVVLDQVGCELPTGKVIEQPVIDGVKYELWSGWEGGLTGIVGWPAFTFRTNAPGDAGSLDLKALLMHLVRRGLMRDDLYLGNVELGTSVLSGAGTAWVQRFDVDLGRTRPVRFQRPGSEIFRSADAGRPILRA